jgi:hypothetical protein
VFAVLVAMLPVNSALPTTQIRWDGYSPVVTSIPLNLFSPNSAEPLQPVTIWCICCGLWCFWCFAMLDRFWYRQFSLRNNIIVFFRHLYRSPRTKYYGIIAVVGSAVFAVNPGISLLSSLTGAVAGMSLIWGTRIVCSYVLGQEALGFGDVTLMAMIGAFLGWQPCILIFFMAPFAGLVFGIVRLLRHGSNVLPYGPFLSAATVVTVLAWNGIWQRTADVFSLGGMIIGMSLFVCLILMGVLLKIIRFLRQY